MFHMFMVSISPKSQVKILGASFVTRNPDHHSIKPLLYCPSFHLLQYFIDCDRQVEMQGVRLPISANHTMFSCANAPYYSFKPARTTRAINISFITEPMEEFVESSISAISNVERFYIPFIMDLKEHFHIKTIFEDIVHYINTGDDLHQLKAEYLLKQLLIDLVLYSHSNLETRAQPVRNVILFIQKNIEKNFCVNELASLAGMSRSTFIRNFNKLTGKRIIEYIVDFKIRSACSILQADPDVKIKEVAQSLGFCDEYYFSNVFKKLTGVSPLEYKKGIH